MDTQVTLEQLYSRLHQEYANLMNRCLVAESHIDAQNARIAELEAKQAG